MDKEIVLASSSPYRRKILNQTGLTFTVVLPQYEEDMTISDSPEELVMTLSEGKARSVADRIDYPAIIIGSDQVFAFQNIIQSKAEHREEAFNRLKLLAGKCHRLISGLTVIDNTKDIVNTIHNTVKIHIRNLSDEEINSYLDTGEWEGVAASYRIEGKGVNIIENIEGDYYSVIGLPIFKLITILRELGIKTI
jgi:septum formation protein